MAAALVPKSDDSEELKPVNKTIPSPNKSLPAKAKPATNAKSYKKKHVDKSAIVPVSKKVPAANIVKQNVMKNFFIEEAMYQEF